MRIGLWVAVVLLIGVRAEAGFITYQVGGPVKGQEQNKVWRLWTEKTLTLWVNISDNTEYLLLRIDTGSVDGQVRVEYTQEVKEKLLTAVKNAIAWSEEAQKNEVD